MVSRRRGVGAMKGISLKRAAIICILSSVANKHATADAPAGPTDVPFGLYLAHQKDFARWRSNFLSLCPSKRHDTEGTSSEKIGLFGEVVRTFANQAARKPLIYGAPDRIRTCDLCLRSKVLIG
jgi:hypothetical protein